MFLSVVLCKMLLEYITAKKEKKCDAEVQWMSNNYTMTWPNYTRMHLYGRKYFKILENKQ